MNCIFCLLGFEVGCVSFKWQLPRQSFRQSKTWLSSDWNPADLAEINRDCLATTTGGTGRALDSLTRMSEP